MAPKESLMGLESWEEGDYLSSHPYLQLQCCLEGSGVPACLSWMEAGRHENPEESPQHPVVAWGGCS